jgi:carbamoyltransferase
MLTIGLSGVQNHEGFLRDTYPDRPEGDYRIRQGMDAAAALVQDGKVIGCLAQERLDRVKQSSTFPAQAVRALLQDTGLGIGDVDGFAYAYNYGGLLPLAGNGQADNALFTKVLAPAVIADQLRQAFPEATGASLRFVDHHLAHAASVFYPSGLDDPLILVADAMGEVASISLYLREGLGFRRIGQQGSLDSIGIFYSLVTMLLGFEFNGDEYKIMGLAPYGSAKPYGDRFDQLLQLLPGGQIRIDALRTNRTAEEKAFFGASRQMIRETLALDADPARIPLEVKQDVAAALQKRTEEAVLHIIRHYKAETGKTELAYAGGVAMNCCANRRIAETAGFDCIYVGCASGDDGSALGAALLQHAEATGQSTIAFPSPYLGPLETADQIDRTLMDFADQVEVRQFASYDLLCGAVVDRLRRKDVVAWHFGRSEFGARALGNRSILADPRHPDMQDKVNHVVKQRESFRPFAPIAMVELAPTWFEVLPNVDYSYMTVVTATRPDHRDRLPAVTHVDGSARLQTVSRAQNPRIHRLLERFHDATGLGVLMNTSFNVKGQPIVNTAREAVETFLSTGLDALVIEGRVLTKRPRDGRSA